MNSSGDALAELLNEMGYDLPQIMVMYDDLSFPFGRMKVKSDGSRSAAGHNGVASPFLLSEHAAKTLPLLPLRNG